MPRRIQKWVPFAIPLRYGKGVSEPFHRLKKFVESKIACKGSERNWDCKIIY